jgi:aconitate hydratase 2/2-methylisocitrate dehydratase
LIARCLDDTQLAELAAVCAKLGHMPSHAEYVETIGDKLMDTTEIYKYLNFHQMTQYAPALESLSSGKKVIPIQEAV